MKVAKIEAEVRLMDFIPEGSTTSKTYAKVYVNVEGYSLELQPVDKTSKLLIKAYAVKNCKQ